MDVQQLIGQARDAITVRQVFGEAYERDGLTIIPAAAVRGGGGGGTGEGPGGEGKGGGGGFGLSARPAGAYVIRGGEVRWEPAVDVNRIVAIGAAVAIAGFLSMRTVAKARAKARSRR